MFAKTKTAKIVNAETLEITVPNGQQRGPRKENNEKKRIENVVF